MAFHFKIVFSGICAFVPDPDGSFDDPDHKLDSVSVLIPNLFRSRKAGGGGRLEPHIPTLEIFAGQGWTGREPELEAHLDEDGKKVNREIHFLRGQTVSFNVKRAAATGIQVKNFEKGDSPPPDLAEPRTEKENTYFWWVPKMEKVAPGSGLISSNLVKPGATDEDRTTARVNLTQGSLSVAKLSRSVAEFKTLRGAPGNLRQKIAVQIALDVEDAESVEVVFEQGNEKTKLSLENAQGEIEIHIRNLEIDHLFGTRPKRKEGVPEVDFETYYELSSVAVAKRLVPQEIVGNNLNPSAGLSLGGVCPPAAFSGTAVLADGQVAPASLEASAEEEADDEKAA
jgi:hypothetical protein